MMGFRLARLSKGKGKGIWVRDRAQGIREEATLATLAILKRPKSPYPSFSNARHVG